MNDTQNHAAIYATLIRYLDTYFIERDLQKTVKMFSPQITGFGTGLDEKSYNINDFHTLYARDIAQAPNTVKYTITKLHIASPTEDTGIVSCELNIKTIILEQTLSLNNFRLSIFFRKSPEGWLLEHMHISLPTVEHDENEAYPIKELEDQNKILQRLVDEKTEILLNTNRELEEAIKEVKTLRGILPICSHCKKIRADDESWNLIESYIMRNSDVEFSHSICPDCAKEYYPDEDLYGEKE